MKKNLMMWVLALTLATNVQATPNKQGKTMTVTVQAPVTEEVEDSDELVAYSDTAAVTDAAVADDDDGFDTVSFDFDNPAFRLIDRFGAFFAFLLSVLVFLFIAAPFLLLAFLLWLVFRNRNRKYKVMEKAMESGQPIPQELVRTERQSEEYLWKKGIKNVALGIGLVIFFACLGAGPLRGIGWLVAFYGLGQAVIAKTSARRKDKREDDLFGDDRENNILNDKEEER